jgi:hypothetical protein
MGDANRHCSALLHSPERETLCLLCAGYASLLASAWALAHLRARIGNGLYADVGKHVIIQLGGGADLVGERAVTGAAVKGGEAEGVGLLHAALAVDKVGARRAHAQRLRASGRDEFRKVSEGGEGEEGGAGLELYVWRLCKCVFCVLTATVPLPHTAMPAHMLVPSRLYPGGQVVAAGAKVGGIMAGTQQG